MEIKTGLELPSIIRTINQDKMNAIAEITALHVIPEIRDAAVLSLRHHTDPVWAKNNGLPGTVVQSLQYYTYVSEMLNKAFPERWLKGGKMQMSFIAMVLAGDTITTKAIVTGKEGEKQNTRIQLDVWCENQRREKVAVGKASVSAD